MSLSHSAILIAQQGSSPQTFELCKPVIVIGRAAPADIILENMEISRQHCRLTLEDGCYYLEDLNSRNGTTLNEEPISIKTLVNNGDRITLGRQVVLLFQETTAQPMMERTHYVSEVGSETVIEPFPELEINLSGTEPKRCPLVKDRMTIGRADDNDIVIHSPILSRHHARLEREGNRWFLEILPDTTNILVLNGTPSYGRQPLKDGDTLCLEDRESGAEIVLVMRLSELPNTPIKPVAHPPDTRGKITAESPSETNRTPDPKSPCSSATIIETLGDKSHPGTTGSPSPTGSNMANLVVTIAGQPSVTFALECQSMSIGRSEDCDIVIHSPLVSRHHAQIERTDAGYELNVSPDVTNTLTCQGRAVTGRRLLQHGDILRIDSREPGMMVSIVFQHPSAAQPALGVKPIQFGQKEKLTFGRDPTNDVVLDMPVISRFHAQLEKVGKRYFVTDLHSTNGTYVNNEPISGKTALDPEDTLRIGPYRFGLGEDQLVKYDDTSGLRVEASGLNKWVRKNINILQDISLVFQPREFIVVVGQSGGGKSTLVDAIAGYRPATHGKVIVNGIDVYHNFDAIRNEIGFVPQRDIIHMELTVYQALDYAAQLRMPRDTRRDERHKRIMEVLEDLDMVHRKDNQISSLSGGQQKRVSIGVELITRPGLFFMDEPTSGLDPGTETVFMHLCRRLADQGRTIIMVTHATKNVMLADKVVFLARGGYLAWFGPPDEALAYFDQYRTERERRCGEMEFDQIYAILDDPSKGTAKEWAKRFQECPAFHTYITLPLSGEERGKLPAAKALVPKEKRKKRTGARISSIKQFFVLSARNVRILTRDRTSLILMIFIAPAVGALDLVIAPLMGREPYDWVTGVSNNGIITLFLLTLYCLLVGGLSQMREFVKETDIYKRERLVNLKIFPYVASKIWIAVLLALLHAFAYTVLHSIAFKMPVSGIEFVWIYITLFFAVLSGMIAGLLASALSPSASSAPMIMIMFIIPQIVLGGVLAPVPESVSQIASLRWAMEGLVGVVGVGSDVAADPCWKLSPELQDIMTLDQKEQFGCRCMGLNMFKEGSCNFPGLGEFYDPTILAGEPTKPDDIGPEPSSPVFPERPSKPADATDQIAMVGFLNALDSYMKDVDRIQEEYMSEVALYKAQTEEYQAIMEKYQTDLVNFNIKQAKAVESGEALIKATNEKFSWTYVNKEDPGIFYPWLLGTWRSQLIIIGVYTAVILFLIKRKDIR